MRLTDSKQNTNVKTKGAAYNSKKSGRGFKMTSSQNGDRKEENFAKGSYDSKEPIIISFVNENPTHEQILQLQDEVKSIILLSRYQYTSA